MQEIRYTSQPSCAHNQLLINKEMVQLFVLLTHVQKKDKMIKSESENKIELKRRDMRRTRKKLNTLTNDQLVFGTSLCILERFIHIFLPLYLCTYSMLNIFHVQEGQS